ncbi:hypothetical protein OP140_002996 [Salmonella enterica]|nr:hypothetical protein [Salmonella enterica]
MDYLVLSRHENLPPRKAGDYDDNGLLNMSQLFWCDTLLQVRTWWLFTDYGANL